MEEYIDPSKYRHFTIDGVDYEEDLQLKKFLDTGKDFIENFKKYIAVYIMLNGEDFFNTYPDLDIDNKISQIKDHCENGLSGIIETSIPISEDKSIDVCIDVKVTCK